MPGPADAVQKAVAFYQDGNLPEAERLCRTVLKAEADRFEVLLLLGLLEHRRKNHREAHRLVSQALRVNDGSADALALHGSVLRALGRHEEALASYDKALAIRPDFIDALYNRGNILRDLQRYAEAIASYDRVLVIVPRDVETLNNRGVSLQELGRYEEALESYGKALAVRPDYPEALNNRGNSLQALNFHEEALAAFNKAIAIRPVYAEALNNRGNALQAVNRLEEALVSYDQALAARPDYPEALRNRGNALQRLNRHEDALACYSKAFAIGPDFWGAMGVGNMLQALSRHEEALASYDRALSMRPDSAEALNNRGNALQALNRHEEALASYQRATGLNPDDSEAHWNEGLTRLAMGDFKGGWEKYEWRWRNRKIALPRYPLDEPAWSGTRDIAGKTVLLYAEQGFGDAIQFIRYAPLVAQLGARVVVACDESLRGLFRAVDGVHAVVTPEDGPPPFDCHSALMSLPLMFGTRLETIPSCIPYLSAEEAQCERWRERLAPSGNRLKVGIAWTGNPRFAAARPKSCPVERFVPLTKMNRLALFSLQKGDGAADVAKLAGNGRHVIDYTSALVSFSDTAALISALDLVITIDTAVAHLAGALGKPVWILLPYAADWRWLRQREDSPWYPTARLFRQPRVGDWNSVIEKVTADLFDYHKG